MSRSKNPWCWSIVLGLLGTNPAMASVVSWWPFLTERPMIPAATVIMALFMEGPSTSRHTAIAA